jgi:hypothetical protein
MKFIFKFQKFFETHLFSNNFYCYPTLIFWKIVTKFYYSMKSMLSYDPIFQLVAVVEFYYQ